MSYKSHKIAFVSGTTGSSVHHVNAISLGALVSVALYVALATRLPPKRTRGFVVQWALLVLPLLLSVTLFANAPFALSALLATPAALALLLPRRDVASPLPSRRPPPGAGRNRFPRLTSLTTYRAHMMLMTILAILAVDFPAFPRALAKCESFGASLMDLGVGSFVFSQGLVSAIPFVSQPSYLLEPTPPKLLNSIRKSLPILVLGLIRVLLVKGTDYPEHVTEYGVHWNFFLTLALVPILQVTLHPILARYPVSLVAILAAIGQQALLTQFGLQSYVLTGSRSNIIGANREGIVSLPGYFVIHLLGLSVGTIVLPHSPSYFRRHQHAISLYKKTGVKPQDFDKPPGANYRQVDKTAAELFSYSFLWWILLFCVKTLEIGGKWGPDGGISRRMVNLPYILWTAAFNTSFLLGYLVLLDILFYPQPKQHKKELNSPQLAETDNTPSLFSAINNHGLTVFLAANLLTGAVNFSISTLYTSDFWAMCILALYSMIVCGIAWKLERKNDK